MYRVIFGSPKQTLAGKLIALSSWIVGIPLLAFSISELYLLGIIVSVLIWYSLRDFAGRADAWRVQQRRYAQQKRETKQRDKERARIEAELRKLPGPTPPVPETPKHESCPEPKPDPEPAPSTHSEMDTATHRALLIRKCMEVLHDRVLHEMPFNGPCKSICVTCNFPGTQNIAGLWMECDARDSSRRRLITRAVRKGTDLCVSNYMEVGTQTELLAYLADEASLQPLLESLQHLSDSVDNRW